MYFILFYPTANKLPDSSEWNVFGSAPNRCTASFYDWRSFQVKFQQCRFPIRPGHSDFAAP
jgi:hypothetical protein